MKTKVFLQIAFRIIILFGTGMAMSYINPHLRELLGDTECIATYKHYAKKYMYDCGCSDVDAKYEWHGPHYWYFWGCTVLFILSLINVVWSIRNIITKHYDDCGNLKK